MRIIIYGVGAIGGTVAAALAHAGQEVIGIARGAQLAAVREAGLTLRSPERTIQTRFTCVEDPSAIDLRPDDVILLTMKTQDTLPALDRLRAAGVTDQPIFCTQNGVNNERFALRRFPNVHGVTVLMPASFLNPGEVAASSTPRHGIFDLGRFPGGRDAADAELAACFDAANISAFVHDDVMARKYGKLLANLKNILDAALGPNADVIRFERALRREAEAVLSAAEIVWRDIGIADPRRSELMRQAPIPGVVSVGNSSAQSLVRGTGSIETDYLNGEIVLLGRLHGVPTPANAAMVALSARLVREGLKPGDITERELQAVLTAAGVALDS